MARGGGGLGHHCQLCMTVLYEDLITVFLPSFPSMLVYNSVSPEFFLYITCFNEE